MITTRIPFDVVQQAAVEAEHRRWSMSQYVAWCVERALVNQGGRPRREKEPAGVGNAD